MHQMRQRGSSIVEVVVMMLIMSVSLIGIYTLVHSSQKLAKMADDRLIATNLAKESLESVGALRDTFLLRAYEVSGCFFTIDASNESTDKCPQRDTDYILSDEKILKPTNEATPVCINKNGWYSQET
jgi:Tfp pilus assembly protein PilV